MKRALAAGLAATMLAASALVVTGCSNNDTLRKKYEDYFLIGATMNYGNYVLYDDIVNEFSSMTCENEMK